MLLPVSYPVHIKAIRHDSHYVQPIGSTLVQLEMRKEEEAASHKQRQGGMRWVRLSWGGPLRY